MLYGFLNGAVDVFPIDSLPDLCRNNVTDSFSTIEDLFINKIYVWPDDDLDYMDDVALLLTFPYGLTYSCLYGGG